MSQPRLPNMDKKKRGNGCTRHEHLHTSGTGKAATGEQQDRRDIAPQSSLAPRATATNEARCGGRVWESNPHRGAAKLLNRFGYWLAVESIRVQNRRNLLGCLPVRVPYNMPVDAEGYSRVGMTKLRLC